MENVSLTWLGQSGFIVSCGGIDIACDLYLSDYCKQRSKLDHTRMMAIPLEPAKLSSVDFYLITHGHIDHFDPLTVEPVADANPGMQLYCPPVCSGIVEEFFCEKSECFNFINTFKTYSLGDGIRLVALPAAHEELDKDESGEYIAVSYLLIFDGAKQAVFLAGDTVAYPEQNNYIRDNVPVGYALTLVLPVNGRDERRATLGFKGNLTLREAVELYHLCDADLLVPCHFGMFALNDIPETMDDSFFIHENCRAVIPELSVPFSCEATERFPAK